LINFELIFVYGVRRQGMVLRKIKDIFFPSFEVVTGCNSTMPLCNVDIEISEGGKKDFLVGTELYSSLINGNI